MAILVPLLRLLLVLALLVMLYATPAFSRLGKTGADVDFEAPLLRGPSILLPNRSKTFQTENDSGRRTFTARVKPVRGWTNSSHMVDLELGFQNSIARQKYHMRKVQRAGAPKELSSFDSELFESRILTQYQTHVMEVQFGTQPQATMNLVVDTGSPLVWVLGLPCTKNGQNCAQLNRPSFDPSASASYRKIPCNNWDCNTLLRTTEISPSCTSDGFCQLDGSYGGGAALSSIVGMLSTEDLTFGGGSGGKANDIVMGCTSTTVNMPILLADGIAGFDLSGLALNGQLGHVFSICFIPVGANGHFGLTIGTPLVLGGVPTFPGDAPPVATTVIRYNPIKPKAHYIYVTLLSISVNNILVDIPPYTFSTDGAGDGGVILDTGTTFTILSPAAFNPLVAAIVAQKPTTAPGLPKRGPLTCWNLDPAGIDAMHLPSIEFQFDQGAVMALDLNAAYVQYPDQNSVCLAMTGLDVPGLNIIGNWQMNNQFMIFDTNVARLHFAPYDCSTIGY